MKNSYLDISTIIPVYNSEKTIELCFESVYSDLENSGYSFEIIIVNDGSTDNTPKLLEKIKEGYETSVYIINQQNKGVSSARNAGLKIAKGKYIVFCDSDDRWLKGKTILSLKILNMYPDIKCLGGKFGGNSKYDDLNIRHISLIQQLFKNYFYPSTVILSRDIILANIFFDERLKYAEDYDFFNRITYNYPVAIINDVFTKSITGKYAYGDSGLSANLWKMEKGELHTLYIAYKKLDANFLICLLAIIFSLLKFFKRSLIVFFRKIKS